MKRVLVTVVIATATLGLTSAVPAQAATGNFVYEYDKNKHHVKTNPPSDVSISVPDAMANGYVENKTDHAVEFYARAVCRSTFVELLEPDNSDPHASFKAIKFIP